MRSQIREEFIKKYKFNNPEALKKDASERSYYRITKQNKSYILMDCPPEYDSLDNFIKVTEFLLAHNFSAPKIYEQDKENGFLIIEDFGSNSLNIYLKENPTEEIDLYKLAIDNLIKLAKIPAPDFPKHSKEEMLKGASLYAEYALTEGREGFMNEIEKELDKLDFSENYITLRDYHADNLFILNTRKSYKKIGVIDYQDASSGFLAYDLVSLLEDARRYIPKETRETLYNYFIERAEIKDKDKFQQSYKILSKQRNCRIIGLFNKFAAIDGNKEYLNYLNNVKKYLI